MTNSYEKRPVAEPHNHMVYDKYIKALGLKDSERSALRKRGLIEPQINAARYATKQTNNIKDTYMALGRVVGMNLEGVPGFYIDNRTNNWEQEKVSGLVIPSRDYNGHISSLLIRNDKAKVGKNGKIEGKYITFSSNGKTKGGKARHTTHCPIITGLSKEKIGPSVRITEGILKADIATALGGGIYCLGMHGLKVPEDLEAVLETLEISELIISLDAGEDHNSDMLRAKVDLIQLAQRMGIDFKLEIWDAQHGKGIDDVLKSNQS